MVRRQIGVNRLSAHSELPIKATNEPLESRGALFGRNAFEQWGLW
ncbi:hypothetical protein GLA29479_210 [Lysobacter antibioticus]|nr:hypothetical protein GLA29479_210 [Lysobacter antibioticus]